MKNYAILTWLVLADAAPAPAGSAPGTAPQVKVENAIESNLLRYVVHEARSARVGELVQGILNSKPRTGKTEEIELVLSTDARLEPSGLYRVELTCAH